MALDLNRGVMTKRHPKGLHVSMYIDDPGTYYDARGDRIDESFAQAAGFDLAKNKREKLKQIKLAEYKATLDAEYASAEERLAKELSHNGGHDVRHVGGDQYALFDKAGAKVMVGSLKDVELLIGPVKLDGQEAA